MPELKERDLPNALLRELPQLKRKHPHIYAVQTAGSIYAVRSLTWNEFNSAKEMSVRLLLPEVAIVQKALVWPESIPGEAPAGVFSTLSNVIMDISGFENANAFVMAETWADEDLATNPDHTMVMVICKAFPAYKPEDLYDMNFLDLMVRFKQAEMMLGHNIAEEEPRNERQRHGQSMLTPDNISVAGNVDKFIARPEPDVSTGPRRTGDPLRDPNLGAPDFAADNAFFRKNYTNPGMETPRGPGEP